MPEDSSTASIASVHSLQAYVDDRSAAFAERRSQFSPREREVIHLVALGLTQAEIGKLLFITPSTIKSHLTRAYLRLNLPNNRRTSAVLISEAFRIGLLHWENDHLVLRTT